MIGSFWNLCRACPSMPVDKLHSEYRSTYRWHEFAANAKQDIVSRPPAPNQFSQSNEPPLPRRKKCPELAYKSHEFIIGSEYTSGDVTNTTFVNRARPEERGTPSRRSKSEGPHGVPNGRVFPISSVNETDGTNMAVVSAQPGESSGLFKKTISKLSTEYRLQFVWPRKTVKGQSNDPVEFPRKSISMNAIKSSQTNAMPTVHKKRTPKRKEAAKHELEPLVNDDDKRAHEKQVTITEPMKSVRPFSQAIDQERNNHFTTKRENFGFEEQKSKSFEDNKTAVQPVSPYNNEQWYKEVIALRKKAGEYKCRGWGIEIDPELYKKQRDLWDQVSKRSTLSALSLDSSVHRPITKEEKDQENNKKSFPFKKLRDTTDNRISEEPLLPARVHTIRHHLERTTGPDVEEGALLPSPTREKLMPAIPKRESESQRGSPKKNVSSRHGSPQKGSPQKGSPKKTFKVRSQSVGPTVIDSNESPKRNIRSSSTAPASATTAAKVIKKPGSAAATPPTTDRKPRPSTLSTSIHSRSKSSSLALSARDHHFQKSQNDRNKSTHLQNLNKNHIKSSSATSDYSVRGKSKGLQSDNDDNNIESKKNLKNLEKKLAEHDGENGPETAVSISSCSPQLVPEVTEHIVKSPPEPTRVKSPEQIIMRSPDPVNWTVPLDTGKTFTVTQNVKEGESIISRPQSEVKASTPVDRSLPAIHSAPPELAEQAKLDGIDKDNYSTNRHFEKPIPGSTLICLDDPLYETDAAQQLRTNTTTTSDMLEKARDRFDRFWGSNKEDSV